MEPILFLKKQTDYLQKTRTSVPIHCCPKTCTYFVDDTVKYYCAIIKLDAKEPEKCQSENIKYFLNKEYNKFPCQRCSIRLFTKLYKIIAWVDRENDRLNNTFFNLCNFCLSLFIYLMLGMFCY